MRNGTKMLVVSYFLLGTLLTGISYAEENQPTYYGFFPSSLGQNHKKFTHNIFGFSIDIPANWIFGVSGTPPMAVVFIYPENVNTGKFSENYETIEIGKLPFKGMNLKEAQVNVIRGMNEKHPNLTMVEDSKRITLNSRPAISWTHEWPSKTGYKVVEYITLVESPSGTRSLAVRTTRRDFSSRVAFYDGILKTFEPFKPKY